MIQKLLFLALFLCCAQAMMAQTGVLRGRVSDADNNIPLADASVVISNTGYLSATEADGTFEIPNLRPNKYTVVISVAGYLPLETVVEVKADNSISGRAESKFVEFVLKPTPVAIDEIPNTINKPSTPVATTDIPTVTLDEAESESEGAGDVANLLHANRDVFQNISGFGWSAFRFRERGYDGGNFQTLINGIPFNDAESGLTSYNEFGGLNDVFRNRNSTVGMDPSEFAFSEIGGATNIDTRASIQRKQIRASYAVSNRTYRHRAMLTASTGLLPGGWALTLSGSRRWAQEGYIEATFFDGWSYFLSADKKFGQKHTLNFTVFGTPTKRGRSADSFQEMYDIAGTNYYNPLWGYQNGEKRNSQTTFNHQPTAILRYDWTPGTKTTLTAAAYTQVGVNTFSRLNWLDGYNPAPDFNRRLPSSMLDPDQAALWSATLSADKTLRQIDWHDLYQVNRNSLANIENADGIAGNTVTGNRAVFIIEDTHSDNKEAGANVYFTHSFTPRILINGGANYLWYKGANFKTVKDLLGADYWLDKDFYSQFDAAGLANAGNNDLNVPNNTVQKGEVFGFDFDENIQRTNGWLQGQFSLKKFQFFVGGEANRTTYWRTGNMQNGRFPNNSLGDSEKINFTPYGFKGGATWKINGRNYLYANGYSGRRAPQMRNTFLAPRTRDLVVPNLEMAKIQSIEGGYLLRAPKLRARVTGYMTDFSNEVENVFASAQTIVRVLKNTDLSGLNLDDENTFLQVPIFFGSAVMQGVARRHVGVEIGAEYRPFPSWVLSGATALGRYQYTARPNLLLTLDNGLNSIIDLGKVYQENFYVPRTPQTTASISLKHENRRFWFASLSLNYAANMYYEFDRLRRTSAYANALDPDSEVWKTIIHQQKAPDAFTLDFFGGKSWRIKRKYFVNLNVGVNNILNNQNILISGRDSYRNAFRSDPSDARFYTNELVYAFGANYFIGLAFRM